MTVLTLIFILVLIPAGLGYCLYTECLTGEFDSESFSFWPAPRSARRHLHPGDYLIYRKSKVSPRPGPRARNVRPSEKGDDYYYEVDKFWAISDVLDDGRLVAVTRTGKCVYLTPEDERLRKANLLARLIYRRRFPALPAALPAPPAPLLSGHSAATPLRKSPGQFGTYSAHKN